MITLDSLRSHLIEMRLASNVAPDLLKLLPMARWNSARLLAERARRHPRDPGLFFEDRRYSWQEIDQAVDRYARFFSTHGIGRRDVVALLLDNRPEFLFAQTALTRIGAIPALLNSNLRGDLLAHALRAGKAGALLAGTEHAGAVQEIRDSGALSARCWFVGDGGADAGVATIDREIEAQRGRVKAVNPKPSETACYIYTSGTTGLPKASIVTHQRWLHVSVATGRTFEEASRGDVIYCPLPLYHSTAQFLGWGAALVTGAALALRRKFSVHAFWPDVHRYRATVFIYIGELCRYLLNAPERREERGHRLRVAVGSGLRAEIWPRFQERFAVPLIREFYGATEGIVGLVNFEGRPGYVGRGRLWTAVIRCDLESGEPIRGAGGHCERVGSGETGLLIGRANPFLKFDGYVDAKANDKKILRDVFRKGDVYYNTGDLVRVGPSNWLAFADRIGDGFRWKGENVSAAEVESVLDRFQGVTESCVYGVTVPGAEGRAGMAALEVASAFDLRAFAAYVMERLPVYQRPYFVRVLQSQVATTGTFKHAKAKYREEGFNPATVNDSLYFLDRETYVPLDQAAFERILSSS